MKQYPVTAIGIFIITVVVCVIKVFHFSKKINRKKPFYFFIFPETNIMVSSTKQSADAKRLQNRLSVTIALLIVLAVASYVLFPVI